MPFILRVSFWRRAGSRFLGQEVHPISQNGKFAIRKSYGACNCNEKRKRTRCNRRPRGRTGRDMSVQVKRVFIMSITKISNRRLPQAETRSSTKGGLAPSWRACRSLVGVKLDVGAFNRRQHMEVTTNAGEWVRANAYYHNMEQRIRGLRYWLRRWVAANRQKIAVKWCASWGRDWCGLRAGETNRLVTSAAQRICMVAVTGANSVCRQGRCWVLGAGA